MEVKSRYEVIADLEKQRQDLIREENGFADAIRKKEIDLKQFQRAVEDREEDIKYFKETINERKDTIKKLHEELENDYLTGIHNKRHFTKKGEKIIEFKGKLFTYK